MTATADVDMTLPKRKNHRLRGYDYGSSGYYYVTICTLNRRNLLCKIVGSDAPVAPRSEQYVIYPTEIGAKVTECFSNIAILNENVEIVKFQLMPNHLHAIISISNTEPVDARTRGFDFEVSERRGRRSLQGLIKDFKSVTTRFYKKTSGSAFSLWQNSFYDEVIRDRAQYERLWRYIDENPQRWGDDSLFNE